MEGQRNNHILQAENIHLHKVTSYRTLTTQAQLWIIIIFFQHHYFLGKISASNHPHNYLPHRNSPASNYLQALLNKAKDLKIRINLKDLRRTARIRLITTLRRSLYCARRYHLNVTHHLICIKLSLLNIFLLNAIIIEPSPLTLTLIQSKRQPIYLAIIGI